MTTMDTARRRPPRRGACPTSVSTYALGTYPRFADDPRCACRHADPNLFFPSPGGQSRRAVATAKAICRSCPLVDRCREWALDQTWVEGCVGCHHPAGTQTGPPLPYTTWSPRGVPARHRLPPRTAMKTVPIRPDPRISNLPPAWLTGPDWRDHLDTLDDADVDWIQDEWAAAAGPWHTPDGPDRTWTLPLILLALAVPYTVFAIWVEVLR